MHIMVQVSWMMVHDKMQWVIFGVKRRLIGQGNTKKNYQRKVGVQARKSGVLLTQHPASMCYLCSRSAWLGHRMYRIHSSQHKHVLQAGRQALAKMHPQDSLQLVCRHVFTKRQSLKTPQSSRKLTCSITAACDSHGP